MVELPSGCPTAPWPLRALKPLDKLERRLRDEMRPVTFLLALGAVLHAHDLDSAASNYDSLVLIRHHRQLILTGLRHYRFGQDEFPPVCIRVRAEVGDESEVDDLAFEVDTYIGVVALRAVPLKYLRPGANLAGLWPCSESWQELSARMVHPEFLRG